jgi:protein TonB
MAQNNTNPPELSASIASPFLIAFAFGVGVFFLLAVSQMLSVGFSATDKSAETTIMEPPQLIDLQEPPEEEIEEEEIEELEEDVEPPTLEQLEIAMNADVSGLASGDFTVDAYSIKSELDDLIFEIKDLSVRPEVIEQSSPIYPPDLRRNKISGEVMVEFVVRPDGRTDKIRITKSTNSGFDESTRRAVQRWRFKPGEKDGKAVSTRVRIPIPFNAR